MRTALITGITGQDGSYLAELLLARGYKVHGLVRRTSSLARERLDPIRADAQVTGKPLYLHYADLMDPTSLVRIVEQTAPDEIYHLASQSHVGVSFEMPLYTGQVTGVGTLALLEAVRVTGVPAKFYQASTSELFGTEPPPQTEETRFHPRSPYGVAKLFSYWAVRNYREAYGMFASNGILFNHESPRRGENFVTRKISMAAASCALGLSDHVLLGNLDAVRDWGYAPEYVEAMVAMLAAPTPADYVIATGVGCTVRDFASHAFARVGLDWRAYVRTDPSQHRPADVPVLVGDASLAERSLGWRATTMVAQLAEIMVDADLALLRRQHGLQAVTGLAPVSTAGLKGPLTAGSAAGSAR